MRKNHLTLKKGFKVIPILFKALKLVPEPHLPAIEWTKNKKKMLGSKIKVIAWSILL